MILRENQIVKNLNGTQQPLGKTGGGGDVGQLTERVETLEDSVDSIEDSVGNLNTSVQSISGAVADMADDIQDIDTAIVGIKNYLNSPSYSEQVLCYAEGAAAHTKVTNPGRIAYVYEIDKSSGKKVLSSNMFFVKSGYIGNNDVTIKMTKGVVLASLYGNPDNKFVFSVLSSEEPENLNIVYLCGTIARI